MSEEKSKIVRLSSCEDEMIGRYISMEFSKVEADASCPTEEDIGAYIDNTIDFVERDRIAGHLCSCKDCYEVFSMASGLLEDMPRESWFSAKTIIFRYVPYSLAAAAAVFLIMFYIFRDFSADKLSFVEDRVAVLAENADKDSMPSLSKQESAGLYGFADMSSAEGSSFRAGIYLADLEIALLLGDKENSLRLLSELVALLRSTKGTDDTITFYKDIKIEIEEGASLKQFTDRTGKLVHGVKDPLYVRFGQWCEGGRVAAIERKSIYFSAADVGVFIKELESADLPKGILGSLHKIERVVIEEAYTEKQFRKLQKEFESLILLF